MNMVGHNDELVKPVSFTIEMQKRILNDPLYCGYNQKAFAVSSVEPALKAFREEFIIFCLRLLIMRLRVHPQPFLAFVQPLAQFFLWQRIGGAKGDEVCRPLLPPMGKIAGEMSD